MKAEIVKLDHAAANIALEIYELFQVAYRVEAGLIGASRFPPLDRDESEIQRSQSDFHGIYEELEMVAVLEYATRGTRLSIDSLVVHPTCFRRRFASYLLGDLLDVDDWTSADVETAAGNSPAILLYQKFGFTESKRWVSTAGIEKIRLCRARNP